MTAYVVIDLDIVDPAGFQQYVDGVVPLMQQAGGRNLVVDPNSVVLEGDWRPSVVVVHEFPTRSAAEGFWTSADYAPYKEMRRKYSTVNVVLAEAS